MFLLSEYVFAYVRKNDVQSLAFNIPSDLLESQFIDTPYGKHAYKVGVFYRTSLTPNEYIAIMCEHPQFGFTDRDSYLQWVANWKITYNTISNEIRSGKNWHLKYLARVLLKLRHFAKKRSWEMKQARLAAIK